MEKSLAILLAIVLGGCAQTAADGWRKSGASRVQTSQDFKECTYQANAATPGYSGGDAIASGISSGMRVNDLRRMCLEARGYQAR